MEKEGPKSEPFVSGGPKVDDYICDMCVARSVSVASLISSARSCGEGAIDPEVEIPCDTPEQVKELMKGLDSKTAAARLEAYGPNEIPQKVVRWYTILLKQLTSSMAVMIEMVYASACFSSVTKKLRGVSVACFRITHMSRR